MEVCCQDERPSQHNKTMDNKESTREMISKGVIGLFVGLSLLTAGILTGRQLHIVWSVWPCTDGEVVRAGVQEVFETPAAKGEMPLRSYAPKVEFRYRVMGKEFTTEAVSVYIASTYEQASAHLARMYRVGTHHPIRYNPRNPSDIKFGVIDFGSLIFSFLLLVIGVTVSVAGVRALAVGYAQRVEPAPAKAPEAPAVVLPFIDRAKQEPPPATLRCPACGRPVKATEDTCPNCMRFLRAA